MRHTVLVVHSDTPGQIPFDQRAAFGRWHKAVRAREKPFGISELSPEALGLGPRAV
jgi:hypothetical protein